MSRGRRPSPDPAPRGTSHHEDATERVVEIVEQTHDDDLARCIAAELPAGTPRDVFVRAVAELGGKVRDTDLEALRMMAWSLHRHQQAQELVSIDGLMVDTPFGPKVNPMLKVARDEGSFYLKIADQYALTFVSRLRAGLMQLAGQSMLEQLHAGVAGAIVDRILAIPREERRALTAASQPVVCKDCGRAFKNRRALATHRVRAHPAPKKRKRKKP